MLILGIIMNGVSEGSGRQIRSYQGRVGDYVRTTNWEIGFDACDLRSAAARKPSSTDRGPEPRAGQLHLLKPHH